MWLTLNTHWKHQPPDQDFFFSPSTRGETFLHTLFQPAALCFFFFLGRICRVLSPTQFIYNRGFSGNIFPYLFQTWDEEFGCKTKRLTIWFLERQGSAVLYRRTHFPTEIDSFHLTLPVNGIIHIKITINLGVRDSHLRLYHLALTSMSDAPSLQVLRRGGTLLFLIKLKKSKFLQARLDAWE